MVSLCKFACGRAVIIHANARPARAARRARPAIASFNDSAGRLKIYAKLLLTGKHKRSLGTSRESVESIYVKF